MTRPNRPVSSEDTGERDAGWVRAALDGDAEAFGKLVEAYQRPAVSVAYRLLGNSHDAMEIAQDAFLRAYRSLGKLQEPGRFGPWLMRIVSNLSLNRRRGRKTSATVELDEARGALDAATPAGRPVVTSVTPEVTLEHMEMHEALAVAIEDLPEKQRVSLVLFAVEGWAQKDIAELLECSIENVKWNVFQARKKLREMLGDKLSF